MEKMTDGEWRAFVMEGTRTGKAGVTRKDGTPHVTPIWFVLDGDALMFNTSGQSVKGRVLARDPRVSICVDDQTPPYSYVLIQAEAEIVEDLDESLRWATAIGARYMGPERAEEFGRRNAVPSEYLVRARITKVIAERAVSD
ncbi:MULTISPECIES: PPOX class F420-dependent oxidoreductase [Actinomadura]|uniref:Pyridoxamine 5'-phosphate oxidase N-terminal domain-containing protein n=1 Tax=Actinomadura madurae TaxID=1993 RepID=A0A1I5HP83_9ACTN|nr:PPOX class F420-dependent oxidoreductase [Actinomadura madurae]MCP9947528.1 PPOX class F420-dependent oxidoreductase [Actinomadura madurae]MCP9964296.1 PPOX class F420-dependent oxidoreductase [Actinomadura madurae]MCP9976779.1 PPOX class F420-dependent oxidoreductase [Actinomadura madurae]MCQ0011737.1 PPOX class F420-dependent oxidoreductase [Actinomadura madurae]MCQ0012959.1 PPOX class F420-dependent oxidoreductase [Actinomadura madurae]